MEFPHLCGCAPTAPSLDPAPVQAQSFQQEWKGKWKANPKGMATTWYLHRQGTHIHTNILGPPGQSLCSVSALRGCWRDPGACQTPRSQHHGGTSAGQEGFPHAPLSSLRLYSHSPNPHYLPKSQQKGTAQPQLCSRRYQLHFPPAHGPRRGRSRALRASTAEALGEAPGRQQPWLPPCSSRLCTQELPQTVIMR